MHAPFQWNTLPQCDSDFEMLMQAIDRELANRGLRPAQRPLHVPKLLWEAFRWEGDVFPGKELALQHGFDGPVLLAKAYRWYDDNYEKHLDMDFALGHFPVRLGNATWRARAPVVYGTVVLFLDRDLQNAGNQVATRELPASFNMLTALEGLPKGLADRLSDGELHSYAIFYARTYENLGWRGQLPRTELLDMARADYESSTDDVLARRYSQARWGAQQAIEKTMKGLLAIAGTPFPTGGAKGHDLVHIAGLLSEHHGVSLPDGTLTIACCSARVRYGDEASSEAQAVAANHAVLDVLSRLRGSPEVKQLLRRTGA
jgi:HEPN domain-containing protein